MVTGMDRHTTAHEEQIRQGATLRTIRELRGLSANDLALELNISRPYLVNIEAGRKKLNPILVARIAAALEVPQIALVREGYFDREDAERRAEIRRLERQIENLQACLDQALTDGHRLRDELDAALAATKGVA